MNLLRRILVVLTPGNIFLVVVAVLGRGELFPVALGDVVTHSAPSFLALPDDSVASFSVRIEQKIAHDPSHFVQGLFISGDSVFEGTGRYGESKLIRYHLNRASNSLEVIWRKALASNEFGEGITTLNNVLYQLTWKKGPVYRYHHSGESVEQLPVWLNDREGWGLTTDGKSLIASDGSDTLFFRSAKDFSVERVIKVRHLGKPVFHLNELEFVDGRIWANVWKTRYIVVIDPENGSVSAIIDCKMLIADAQAISLDIGVLNGIAWDEDKRDLYLTGKLWPWIYRVSLDPKQ
jgi:glutamine cyclotransferase